MKKTINILGIEYEVKEVPVVDKADPAMGMINYFDSVIYIDSSIPDDLKEQTLCHELLHAICWLTGNNDISGDERAIQGISTALYEMLKNREADKIIGFFNRTEVKAPDITDGIIKV